MLTTTASRFDELELSRAIDALYATFDVYGLAERVDFCPHCDLDDAERQLHAVPLRELSWADLRDYWPRAVTTFGDESDLKHFLPRILELYVIDHRGAPCSLFVAFGKLDLADWESWTTVEVAAVRLFIEAWKRVLARTAKESEDAAWEFEELRAGIIAL